MDNNGEDNDQHQVGQLGFSCHKALHECFPFLRKACATEVILCPVRLNKGVFDFFRCACGSPIVAYVGCFSILIALQPKFLDSAKSELLFPVDNEEVDPQLAGMTYAFPKNYAE
jgi:hypothetical protein